MSKAFTLWTHRQLVPAIPWEPVGLAYLSTRGSSHLIVCDTGEHAAFFFESRISMTFKTCNTYTANQP